MKDLLVLVERVNTPDTYQSALPRQYDRRQVTRTVVLTRLQARAQLIIELRKMRARLAYRRAMLDCGDI